MNSSGYAGCLKTMPFWLLVGASLYARIKGGSRSWKGAILLLSKKVAAGAWCATSTLACCLHPAYSTVVRCTLRSYVCGARGEHESLPLRPRFMPTRSRSATVVDSGHRVGCDGRPSRACCNIIQRMSVVKATSARHCRSCAQKHIESHLRSRPIHVAHLWSHRISTGGEGSGRYYSTVLMDTNSTHFSRHAEIP